MPTPERIPLRDGCELALLRWASSTDHAPSVLMIHGLASNARLWDGVARELASRGYGVAALDLRGHGLSDKPDSGYTTPEVADDVHEVVTHLSRADTSWLRPVVIGQSWGGNIVVELAARHGRDIRGVVAVDGGTIELQRSFPDWEECERTLSPPNLTGMRYERLRGYIRAAHRDWSDEAIEATMHNMEHLNDGTVRPHLTLNRHLMILRGLWEHSPSQLWSQIECPVLFTPAVAHDAHSTLKRQQIEHALATLKSGAVEWFEGADHDLHAQHPHRFANVVHSHITGGIFA